MIVKDIFQLVQNKTLPKDQALQAIEKIQRVTQTGQRLGTYQESFAYDEPYLRDHRVFGLRLLLGVTHCSMALKAFVNEFPQSLLGGIRRTSFVNPVQISAGENADVRITLDIDQECRFTSEYKISGQDQWAISAKGEVILGCTDNHQPGKIDLQSIRQQAVQEYQGRDIYSKIENVEYGESLHTIDKVYRDSTSTLAQLSVKHQLLQKQSHHLCHPALLDGALLSAMSRFLDDAEPDTFIPFFIEELRFYQPLPDKAWCLGKISKTTDEIVQCDFSLCNDGGDVAVQIIGFACKRVKDTKTLLDSIKSGRVNREPLAARTAPVADASSFSPELSVTNKVLLESKIRAYLQNLLTQNIDQPSSNLDENQNFMELGLSSLSLVQIAKDIESEIGIELYPTTFFEYPNLQSLTQYFGSKYFAVFAQHFFKTENGNAAIITQTVAPDLPATRTITTEYSPTAHSALPLIVTTEQTKVRSKDIAVIGMSGVFAKSPDLQSFWQHLSQGSDLMSEIPRSRFDYRPWLDETGQDPQKIYCKWGSFIDDVDKFDANFFNVAQREAEIMDPQLRHLLQITYLTAEDAGYANRIWGSNTGVYVGCCFYDYQTDMLVNGKPIEVYDGISNSPTMLSNRQSFFFDLKGPSLTVDTACSSSLVALHLACRALQNGECDMAFVSGVNLLLTPGHYQYFCRIGALGRSARCHTFDAKADGYIPGEGIAAVLLKPLDRALKDNDQIHGIIKGSAIKHGGHSSSITAPSVKGEEEVILQAWGDADIDPTTIGYIEAHGTGTSLGDPIEFQATEKAFRRYTQKDKLCAIGSAKAHVGHLEGAAGIAGLIKALLSIKHRQIPAMPRFEKLNPYIKSDRSPLYINTESTDWVSGDAPRRVGINSFGFGGTFCHVVVEEFLDIPTTEQVLPVTEPLFFVLSAKSQPQLDDKARQLYDFIVRRIAQEADNATSELSVTDIAYTLQTGREHMPLRLAILARTKTELAQKLGRFIDHSAQADDIWYENTAGSQPVMQIFNSDPNLLKVLEQYIQDTPSLSHIARLWVKGLNFDLNLLYQGKTAKIVSLPGYAFEKNSYWYKPFNSSEQEELLAALSAVLQFSADIDEFKQADLALEALSYQGLVLRLQEMGFFSDMAKNPQPLPELMKKLEILPKFDQLISTLVKQMLDRELLTQTQQGLLLSQVYEQDIQNLSVQQFEQDLQDLNKKYTNLAAFTSLLSYCLSNFADCLRGKKLSTDILFENGSLERVESIYTNNSIADYFNQAIAAYVFAYTEQLLAKQPQPRKIRLLEIGAGTGGTSRFILEKLNAIGLNVEYIYTDVSSVFLDYANQAYQEKYPFLHTQLLDVEKLASSEWLNSDIDIAIASNVLHATRNITQTLSNIGKYALKKGGLLVINELTKAQLFMTLTFGLLDGWWLYGDAEIRIAGTPLLSVETWEQELLKSGFTSPALVSSLDIGQQILAAKYSNPQPPVYQPENVYQVVKKQPVASIPQQQPTNEQSSTVLNTIQGLVAQILGVTAADIEPNTYFMDLGMDSLKGIEFKDTLNKELAINIESVALINYPTAAQLAGYIEERFTNLTLQVDASAARFGRFNVRSNIAEKLKQEQNLKSQTDISKLFELQVGEETLNYEAEKTLYSVFDRHKVSLEFVDTNQTRLEFVHAGKQGEPIVLLSPLNSLAVVWHNQIEELAKKHRVFCFHYPGFGRSQFQEKIFDMDTIGDAIMEALNNLGLQQPYHLIGWSMGGLIGQSIAERYGQKIKTLSLIGTGTISMFDDDYYNEHTHVKNVLAEEINSTDYTHHALKENHDLLVGTYNTEVLMHYAHKIRDFDHKCKRTIQAPVLVINGSNDKVLLPQYAKEMGNNFPNAVYREIKGAGHFLALTHPTKINWHIKNFISLGGNLKK